MYGSEREQTVILGDVVDALGIFFGMDHQIGKIDDVGHPWEPPIGVFCVDFAPLF